MAPKGKKVERKEENISLGPQIRDGAYHVQRATRTNGHSTAEEQEGS
jgi:hypothetical protein